MCILIGFQCDHPEWMGTTYSHALATFIKWNCIIEAIAFVHRHFTVSNTRESIEASGSHIGRVLSANRWCDICKVCIGSATKSNACENQWYQKKSHQSSHRIGSERKVFAVVSKSLGKSCTSARHWTVQGSCSWNVGQWNARPQRNDSSFARYDSKGVFLRSFLVNDIFFKEIDFFTLIWAFCLFVFLVYRNSATITTDEIPTRWRYWIANASPSNRWGWLYDDAKCHWIYNILKASWSEWTFRLSH